MPSRSTVRHPRHVVAVLCASAVLAAPLLLAQPTLPAASTLDRIRAAGRIHVGYRTDARPFSYKDEAGQPAGYSVTVCRTVVDAVKAEPGLSAVAVDWLPIPADERFAALQQGRIDLLCGADTVTIARRGQVSFSVPIFAGGIGAVVRADAPARLREVLTGKGQVYRPAWRANVTQVLQARAFTAVQGTTADAWLTSRIRDLEVIAEVTHASSYDAGVQSVLDRKADAFFGERAALLDSARRSPAARDLVLVDRLFTYEPLALALPRGDEPFRLVVDSALSRLYGSPELATLYAKWFGEPDETALTFFRWNTLPE
jgi:ABC-type amino acid transport substrate-binding protein